MANQRITDSLLPNTYQDGEILYGAELRKIVGILKSASNADLEELQASFTGSVASKVVHYDVDPNRDVEGYLLDYSDFEAITAELEDGDSVFVYIDTEDGTVPIEEASAALYQYTIADGFTKIYNLSVSANRAIIEGVVDGSTIISTARELDDEAANPFTVARARIVSGWLNQDLKTTASPEFANVTTSNIYLDDGEVAILSYNTDDKVAEITYPDGRTLQIGEETYSDIKASGNILDGQCVAVNGVSGNIMQGILADNTLNGTTFLNYKSLGIATQNITNGTRGKVTTFGIVHDLPLANAQEGDAWAEGNFLYVGTSGRLTITPPEPPHVTMLMAIVLKVSGPTADIFVTPRLFPKLVDLSDISDSFVQGDLLSYNATTHVWERKALADFATSSSVTTINNTLGTVPLPTDAQTVTGAIDEIHGTIHDATTGILDVLENKSDVGHTHDSRYPVLTDGKISSSVIPAVNIVKVHVVSSIAERDALTVEEADIAIVTGTVNNSYIYDDEGGWIEFTATGDVISVNGETGVVSLNYADVGAAAEIHYHDTRYYQKSEVDLLMAQNTTIIYSDRYTIETTDGSSTFEFIKNGNGTEVGTITGGFYVFDNLTGFYKIDSNRIWAKVNNNSVYLPLDTELIEGTGDENDNTQEVRIAATELQAGDEIIFIYQQGNDVVSIEIGDGSVTYPKLSPGVKTELTPPTEEGHFIKDGPTGDWILANLFNHTHEISLKESFDLPDSGWSYDATGNFYYYDYNTTNAIEVNDTFTVTLKFDNQTEVNSIDNVGFYGDIDRVNANSIRIKCETDFSVSGISAELEIIRNDAPTILLEGGTGYIASVGYLSYDNSTSGLTATDAQAAIDELAGRWYKGDTEPAGADGHYWLDTTDYTLYTWESDPGIWVAVSYEDSASEIPYDNSTSGLAAVNMQEAIDELAAFSGIVSVTASRDLATTDIGQLVQSDTVDAVVITVQADSFDLLDEVAFLQYGTGTFTIAAGSGVTLLSKDSKFVLNGQYASAGMKQVDTNIWVLTGNLTT